MIKYFRVYKNGSRSQTIEFENDEDGKEELEETIEWNRVMRFGCAQFVDGKCVYNGYLTDEEVEAARIKYCT